MISMSRSFENESVSVWISIQKRAVGFRPNAFLFYMQFIGILQETDYVRLVTISIVRRISRKR